MPTNSNYLKASELLEAGRANVFSKNFYSSLAQYDAVDALSFNEGPAVIQNIIGINTSSIATADVDQFRQGVEITQNKHTFGLVKILAGTPGHFVKPLCYGVSEKDIVSTKFFVELDRFDSISFISQQDEIIYPEQNLTFPIIVLDVDDIDFNFNSILEPLSIRKVASLKSTEFPYEFRSTKGSFESGNAEPFSLSNDQVLTVDYWDTKENVMWYLDAFEHMNTTGSIIQSMGYVNGNLNKIDSFDDSKVYKKTFGISSTTMGADMLNAIMMMSSSTSNYVPPGKKSATSGFVFDNVGYPGTDSIAFGGMTY